MQQTVLQLLLSVCGENEPSCRVLRDKPLCPAAVKRVQHGRALFRGKSADDFLYRERSVFADEEKQLPFQCGGEKCVLRLRNGLFHMY